MFINLPNQSGTFTLQPYQQPAICPGCGKCNTCGRPYEAAPQVQNPWPSTYTYGAIGGFSTGQAYSGVGAQLDSSANPQETR